MSDYSVEAKLTDAFSGQVRSNAYLNYIEYKDVRRDLTSLPVKVYFEPTQNCNLSCRTCSPKRRSAKSHMPLDLFRSIESTLFPTAAEVNFFITGESLIAPDFSKMAGTCSKYTFVPKLFTNGMHMPDELADILLSQGFFVTFSFDAAEEKLFEVIRRGAVFSTVVKNIQNLQKRALSNHKRFHIRLACTLGAYNIEQVVKIVEFARDNGINDVMFSGYDGGLLDRRNMLASQSDKNFTIIKNAKTMADKYKIRFSAPKMVGNIIFDDNTNWDDFSLSCDKYSPLYLERLNPYGGDCPYPWSSVSIRSNGDIVACCQRLQIMGKWSDGFSNVWNGRAYHQLRAKQSFYFCSNSICNLVRYSMLYAGAGRVAGKRRKIINILWGILFIFLDRLFYIVNFSKDIKNEKP